MIPTLPLLPPPGSPVLDEHEFSFTYESVRYVGAIDLLSDFRPRVSVVLTDYKSTGDLKWAKTPEDLTTDPQRITYAHYVAQAFDVGHVLARWIYFRRKPPGPPRTVLVLEDRRNIAARFHDLHTRVGLPIARAAASGLPPEAYPRNLGFCSAFGGCPYRTECHSDLPTADLVSAAIAPKRKPT